MSMSVIMTCGFLDRKPLNMLRFLPFTLDLLTKQTILKGHYELIISDYGTRDGSLVRDVVNAYPELEAQVIHTPVADGQDWSSPRAKNAAIPLAQGKFLCLLNIDTWLDADALNYAYHCILHKTEMCILGRKIDLSESLTEEVLSGLPVESAFKRTEEQKLHARTAKGDFNLLTLDNYHAVGGYDNSYDGYGCDDDDFVRRLVRHGTPIKWLKSPKFKLYHPYHERDKSKFKHNQRRYKHT